MTYITSEVDSPNMSTNTFQLPNQPPVVHQEQYCSPVLTEPFASRKQKQVSTEVLEQQNMNLPSTNDSTPEAHSPSSGTCNSFSTEVAGTNELLDFLLDSPGKEYMTDGDASTQNSENAVQFPKEPLLREQFCTPGLNGHFGTQYENKFSERTTELGFLEKETPLFTANNLGNLPGDFNHGSQKLDSLAGEAPPAISSNEHQPLSEYANLLKMLEDEPEEYNSFGNAPYAGNVDDYFQWLEETLFADSTEEQNFKVPDADVEPPVEHS